ncbi:MAG: 4Fe-4S binding protein [Lachnospiraceae bacterium]|nr:4Fe-4S binding protein [Lachnospiraceae bacterium]
MDRKNEKKCTIRRRRWIQLISVLIYNANLKGFGEGSIYQGKGKGVCVPGLNCYSCPGAVAACPLGTLQNALSMIPRKLPYYILGVFMLSGLLFGRLICGFLCPFGLIQELLYGISVPKIGKSRITRSMTWIKYGIFAVFVVMIPVWSGVVNGYSLPAFCKYICPAGTLEGGIPLLLANENLREAAGWLFDWKLLVLAAILIFCLFFYRFFCRFLCPLGAVYSLFSRISIFGIQVDEEKCSHCGACVRYCRMDIRKPGDRECIQCGECAAHCSRQAIYRPAVRTCAEKCIAGKMLRKERKSK